MKIINASVEFMEPVNGSEILRKIERIGRVCYKSEDKITDGSAEKFVRGIIKSGHESVIEHQNISVKVTCDRGVSHEIVRHRLASYSQESTRYCNYTGEKFGGEVSVIDIATGFEYDLTSEKDWEKLDLWRRAMVMAEFYYNKLIEAGAKPEEARSVLPNSTKTEIVMTMNLREWRHFLRLRGGKAAHPQIREVADMILELFHKEIPVVFDDIWEAKE